MTQELALKAFLRAFMVTLVIIVFMVVLWHYTLITLSALVIAWLALMVQLDPPAYWDR